MLSVYLHRPSKVGMMKNNWLWAVLIQQQQQPQPSLPASCQWTDLGRLPPPRAPPSARHAKATQVLPWVAVNKNKNVCSLTTHLLSSGLGFLAAGASWPSEESLPRTWGGLLGGVAAGGRPGGEPGPGLLPGLRLGPGLWGCPAVEYGTLANRESVWPLLESWGAGSAQPRPQNLYVWPGLTLTREGYGGGSYSCRRAMAASSQGQAAQLVPRGSPASATRQLAAACAWGAVPRRALISSNQE
jgi:hypothetical protein